MDIKDIMLVTSNKMNLFDKKKPLYFLFWNESDKKWAFLCLNEEWKDSFVLVFSINNSIATSQKIDFNQEFELRALISALYADFIFEGYMPTQWKILHSIPSNILSLIEQTK